MTRIILLSLLENKVESVSTFMQLELISPVFVVKLLHLLLRLRTAGNEAEMDGTTWKPYSASQKEQNN